MKSYKAGYEYLLAYKITVPIYDYTVKFVDKYISKFSRTCDQMVQAARSGMQNISEGYKQEGLKGYIKLSGVARGSLEELLKDYVAYARQHKIEIWEKEEAKGKIREIGVIWEIIRKNPTLSDSPNFPSLPDSPDLAVNLLITLIHQANYLIDKLISSLKEKHMREGGLTEELYKKRVEYRKNQLGFTFIELMVVTTITGILIVAMIAFFDPIKQIQKSQDGKRISELNTLQKVLEDFYNDKNRFPLPSNICFDSPSAPRTDLYGKTACSCHICGNSSTSPSFSPYLPSLPCDPQSTQKEYLYDYDCSTASPGWYRIYTKLSLENNPVIIQAGCGGGCGPPIPDFPYNYAVYSNAQPETILCSDYVRLWQKDGFGNCNICKSPSGGNVCDYNNNLYYQSGCTQKCSP